MGIQRGWCEHGIPPTPSPDAGPAQHPPAPTLPPGVSLGVLQGLGGCCEGDALEDVDIAAEEAELLVDAFHEAAFRVHRAQLQGRVGGLRRGAGAARAGPRCPEAPQGQHQGGASLHVRPRPLPLAHITNGAAYCLPAGAGRPAPDSEEAGSASAAPPGEAPPHPRPRQGWVEVCILAVAVSSPICKAGGSRVPLLARRRASCRPGWTLAVH